MTLNPQALFAVSALAVAMATAQAQAATEIADNVTVSAFGTTGLVTTNDDEVEYVRDGAPTGSKGKAEFDVDSNFGVQLNANPTRWLFGTVQLLTQQRYEPNLDTEVEWAFVGVEPVEGLRLRAGRTALPMFMISDTRNVGFANTWVRPPDEVYGMALLHRLDGVDASYQFSLGSTSLQVTALAGDSEMNTAGIEADVEDVLGFSARWETKWATFRAGRVEGDVELDEFGIPGETELYTFSDIGVIVDRNNVVAQAEYVTRTSDDFSTIVDAAGWYVLGGYRFGDVLPYGIYSTTKPDNSSSTGQMSYEQTTISAGVRWDAFSAAAIKFQLDYVDTDGTPGISFATPFTGRPQDPFARASVDDPVVVASISVDFVF